MNLDELKNKLIQYKKEDIIVNKHTRDQADVRKDDIEEVKENIVNPDKLVYFEQQQAKSNPISCILLKDKN